MIIRKINNCPLLVFGLLHLEAYYIEGVNVVLFAKEYDLQKNMIIIEKDSLLLAVKKAFDNPIIVTYLAELRKKIMKKGESNEKIEIPFDITEPTWASFDREVANC